MRDDDCASSAVAFQRDKNGNIILTDGKIKKLNFILMLMQYLLRKKINIETETLEILFNLVKCCVNLSLSFHTKVNIKIPFTHLKKLN